MAAKYPEIFIRPAGVPLDLSSGNTELFIAAHEGWTRLQNVLKGASFKIDPGLQQKLNRGQTRTLSEKIGVEVKLTFIDQNAYNAHRQLINQDTDMVFYDPDDPSDMITAFWGLSLSVKAEMEDGNGYTVILGAEHGVSTGKGVTMESNSSLRLVTFNVYNAETNEPLAAEIALLNNDIVVSESGTAWVLAHYEAIGDDDAAVAGTGYNHEAYSIAMNVIYHDGQYEHIVNVGLVVIEGNTGPQFSFDPQAIDFGEREINSTTDKKVDVVGTKLAESTIGVQANGAFMVSLSQNGPYANAQSIKNYVSGTSIAVWVRFAPIATENYSDTVWFDSGNLTAFVPVTGKGIK